MTQAPTAAARALAASPSITVIIPVWNVEAYLRQCLDSVFGQTIGLDRLRVIAVDDGSTDDSGAILDEYAARYPQLTVIHDPNSGGPGRPRNVGLDHATTPFVFFLDADDYLGPEALERLLAMAERNASDIVIGKIVGVGGRRMYRRSGVFWRNADRVDVALAYQSGNVLKLFRRSLIERLGRRFPEGIPGGEDGDFMAPLYLEAETISVVADYDCYYVRHREGSQTTRSDRDDDIADYIARLERARIMDLVERVRPGPERDVLMRRHMRKLARMFRSRWRSLEPDDRRRAFDVGAAVVHRWHKDRIQRALPAWARIRLHCLQHGLFAELEDVAATNAPAVFRDPIVEGGRVYARYPHFRDASGIPDSCFDVTSEVVLRQTTKRAEVVDGRLELSGHAFLPLVGGSTSVEVRRWPRGGSWLLDTRAVPTPELRDTVIAYPRAGFEVAADLASVAKGRPLPDGAWRIRLAVGTDRVRRTAPLRAPRGWTADDSGKQVVDRVGRVALYAGPGRELRLRIGHPGRVTVMLERIERLSSRLVRRLRVATKESRVGRRLGRRVTGRLRRLGSRTTHAGD